ncbi:helix-turn-helix domain-containing protein [Mesorhizobium sp. YM1C-6-2]|uniref:helix-turn-helix domain-containing protein n=1 Tax=Mesorhizobium sp. YM1C-6-2 TaxID=1827501 RepID=UPI000EF26BB2|nr:helix-turn-helix domain-containing protein [Mesorhizobium sp. YM1C-6-2]RLP28386.1 DNA-binding protein [Mesorhizobium sp. YM1C-6-2]
MTEPLAVSITEACHLLGVGRSKLYELIAAKEIPLIKLGRKSLLPVASLRAFIENKAKEAA